MNRNLNIPLLLIILFLLLSFQYKTCIAKTGNEFYSLQMGSFQDEENAKAMTEDLKRRGHNAFFKIEKEGNKDFYRVYIERYSSRQEAEKEAEVMKKLDLIPAYTIRKLEDDSETNKQVKKNRPDGYYLHIASCRIRENADQTVEEISRTGRSVFIRHEDLQKKGEWYRVYVDGYNSREEALNDARKMKRLGLITDYELESAQEIDQAGQNLKKSTDNSYILKIGSYKEKKNADLTILNIKKVGRNAFYKHLDVPGKGKWYRVYVDGYNSREEALNDAREMKGLGLITGYELESAQEIDQAGQEVGQYSGKRYFLHIESYMDMENAQKRVEELKGLGQKAFFLDESSSDSRWFKVYIGVFESEGSARKTGLELKEKGLITYFKPVEINEWPFKKQ